LNLSFFFYVYENTHTQIKKNRKIITLIAKKYAPFYEKNQVKRVRFYHLLTYVSAIFAFLLTQIYRINAEKPLQ